MVSSGHQSPLDIAPAAVLRLEPSLHAYDRASAYDLGGFVRRRLGEGWPPLRVKNKVQGMRNTGELFIIYVSLVSFLLRIFILRDRSFLAMGCKPQSRPR